MDTLNGNVRHRSSYQEKKDQEAQNAAKAAEEQSINTAKHQKQMHIASLKNNLQKEDVFQESSQFILTFKPSLSHIPRQV